MRLTTRPSASLVLQGEARQGNLTTRQSASLVIPGGLRRGRLSEAAPKVLRWRGEPAPAGVPHAGDPARCARPSRGARATASKQVTTVFKALRAGLGIALCLLLLPGVASASELGSPVAEPDPLGTRASPVPPEWLPRSLPPATGQLPAPELTGELLYQILAADFAAQRGAWAAAINTSLQVARQTRDPRMAQRALEFSLASDNLPRAWDSARVWLELAPHDPQAQQAEVMLAAANGRTDNLARVLADQLAQTPDKGEAILQIQIILSRLSDKQAALLVLEELLAGPWGQLPEARAALAQAAYEAGDAQRALAEARAALAARPDWDIAAGMVLQFGLPLQPEATLAEVRSYLERHPADRSIRLSYVSALVRVGRVEEALAEVERMMSRTPEDFELLYLRGAINAEAGRPREARKWLDEYIAIETDRRRSNPEAFDPASSLADAEMMRVRMAEDAGNLDEAYRLLLQVRAPEAEVQAGLRKAMIRARQERIPEAMAELDAIEVEDDREAVLVALTRAQLLRDAGRLEGAVQALESALQQFPESHELRYDLALLYGRQERYEDLEYQLRQIIEADRRSAHAFNALGYTLADRSMRLDEARQLIERALELRPQDPAILDSMGWVLYRQGDLPQAQEYLQRAWERLPDAEIGTHLGEVLWQMGQQDQARAVWRKVLATEPDNDLLRDTLRRLGVSLEAP